MLLYSLPLGTQRAGNGALFHNNRLNLDLLHEISQKPPLYSGRDPSFWSDPYVSEHLLNAHLDPDTDDASRRPDRIDETVRFILEQAGEPGRLSVLDLGCGPGLYAEQFAEAGCKVTGIDFSPSGIDHAREQASKLGLSITYRCEDLRAARFDGPYDVVLLIYGEFCTFSEQERADLLERVRRALKPGGLFVFDVFTRAYVDRVRGGNDWYVSVKDGFWKEARHLVLEQTFRYPAKSISAVRYTIIGELGDYQQFSVWWRHYTVSEIKVEIARSGLFVKTLYGSLWGSPVQGHDEWIGVFCRNSEEATATTATTP